MRKDNMGRLDKKAVIITGATGGIGKVATDIFTGEGANVVACDLIEEGKDALLASAQGNAGDAFFVKADLTDERDVQSVVQTTVKHFGRVDVLFNNHGVMVGKPFLETTMEEFDFIINGNLRSVFMACQYASKEMVKTGGGSIINVSSVGGIVGFPNMAAYSASKGGLAQLSRALATDLAQYAIRVNAICPGVIDTPQPREYMKDVEDKEALWKEFENLHLLKRVGKPEEVVWLAVYLASDESSFMTGTVIPIDGGLTTV
jgi:NAD(P)-dependent dehydrogenase (short-subunit alcohol dehydrogenase family)